MNSAMRTTLLCQSHCSIRPQNIRRTPRDSVIRAQSYQQNGNGSSQLGDRILSKLRTPLDLLALPGRVAAGALTSLPQVMQNIPMDLERLSILIKDPRSLDEKQHEVLQELESRVLSYLDRGTDIEAGVLNNICSVLPQEVKDALPADVKEFLVRPHHVEDSHSNSGSNGATPNSAATAILGDGNREFDMPITVPPAQLAASQIASEMSELRVAVLELQEQLGSLRANTDPSEVNMLKINVRESRLALVQHLRQLSPAAVGTEDPHARAAITEAEQLLAQTAAVL